MITNNLFKNLNEEEMMSVNGGSVPWGIYNWILHTSISLVYRVFG